MARDGDIKDKNVRCSFCNKSQNDVKTLIAGPGVYICNECVALCREIVEEETDKKTGKSDTDFASLKKPSEIKALLDEYVIGQDDAKIALSVAVYNHYKRLAVAQNDDEVELDKSNIVLVGATGTGKTLMARTIARVLNVPFTIVDATVLTEAGYVGEDVESILSRLLQVADYDVAAAERGIVFDAFIGVGGIAQKAPFVMQMLADAIGKDIRVSQTKQSCALGSAICASVVAGIYPTIEAAQAALCQPIIRTYTPNAERRALLQKRHEMYRAAGKFTESLL